MADWGLLAGLGEAMKGFGNAWSDKSTAELKERLAREREERANAREDAKEARLRKQEESTPVTHKIERDSDGATWRVPYNKFDQPLGERVLASPEDIKNYNFEDKKRTVSLDNLVAQGQRAQEMHEANLQYKEASTDAARARAARTRALPLDGSGRGSSSKEPTAADFEAELAKQADKELSEYNISETQKAEVVRAAVDQAARYGIHPKDVLREILFERQFKKKNRPTQAGTGGVKLGN